MKRSGVKTEKAFSFDKNMGEIMDRLNFAFAVQPNRIQHDIGMETGGEYARKKSGLSTVLGLIRTFKQVLVGQKLHARHLQK